MESVIAGVARNPLPLNGAKDDALIFYTLSDFSSKCLRNSIYIFSYSLKSIICYPIVT